MAAPHLAQNLTPTAIGDPQLPQNPAMCHLRKILVAASEKSSTTSKKIRVPFVKQAEYYVAFHRRSRRKRNFETEDLFPLRC
jgi:hypothetical protein